MLVGSQKLGTFAHRLCSLHPSGVFGVLLNRSLVVTCLSFMLEWRGGGSDYAVWRMGLFDSFVKAGLRWSDLHVPCQMFCNRHDSAGKLLFQRAPNRKDPIRHCPIQSRSNGPRLVRTDPAPHEPTRTSVATLSM